MFFSPEECCLLSYFKASMYGLKDFKPKLSKFGVFHMLGGLTIALISPIPNHLTLAVV